MLFLPHCGVGRILAQQLAVPAAPDYTTAIDYNDLVGMDNG